MSIGIESLKRGHSSSTSSLIPFPRVGRSASTTADIIKQRLQRSGASHTSTLVPFPRVGRTKSSLVPFPRVGKSSKSSLVPFPRVGKSLPEQLLSLPEEGIFLYLVLKYIQTVRPSYTLIFTT